MGSELEDLIDKLSRERPYLESPLGVYRKVRRFEEACEQVLEEAERLPPGLVLKAFLEAFEIEPGVDEKPLESLLAIIAEDPVVEERALVEGLTVELPNWGSPQEVERLFFIFKKPYLKFKRKKIKGTKRTDPAKCPVCNKYISLTFIDVDNRRHMVCPLCGHKEEVVRIGCSYCLQKDPEKIRILLDEDDIRVELCEVCKTYIKSFRADVLNNFKDPNLIDILSLPLDVVVQQQGYVRRSPNAIGVKEVSNF